MGLPSIVEVFERKENDSVKNEKELPILEREQLPDRIFRYSAPHDETDRIGREIVRRMMEAGVVEKQ